MNDCAIRKQLPMLEGNIMSWSLIIRQGCGPTISVKRKNDFLSVPLYQF